MPGDVIELSSDDDTPPMSYVVSDDSEDDRRVLQRLEPIVLDSDSDEELPDLARRASAPKASLSQSAAPSAAASSSTASTAVAANPADVAQTSAASRSSTTPQAASTRLSAAIKPSDSPAAVVKADPSDFTPSAIKSAAAPHSRRDASRSSTPKVATSAAKAMNAVAAPISAVPTARVATSQYKSNPPSQDMRSAQASAAPAVSSPAPMNVTQATTSLPNIAPPLRSAPVSALSAQSATSSAATPKSVPSQASTPALVPQSPSSTRAVAAESSLGSQMTQPTVQPQASTSTSAAGARQSASRSTNAGAVPSISTPTAATQERMLAPSQPLRLVPPPVSALAASSSHSQTTRRAEPAQAPANALSLRSVPPASTSQPVPDARSALPATTQSGPSASISRPASVAPVASSSSTPGPVVGFNASAAPPRAMTGTPQPRQPVASTSSAPAPASKPATSHDDGAAAKSRPNASSALFMRTAKRQSIPSTAPTASTSGSASQPSLPSHKQKFQNVTAVQAIPRPATQSIVGNARGLKPSTEKGSDVNGTIATDPVASAAPSESEPRKASARTGSASTKAGAQVTGEAARDSASKAAKEKEHELYQLVKKAIESRQPNGSQSAPLKKEYSHSHSQPAKSPPHASQISRVPETSQSVDSAGPVASSSRFMINGRDVERTRKGDRRTAKERSRLTSPSSPPPPAPRPVVKSPLRFVGRKSAASRPPRTANRPATALVTSSLQMSAATTADVLRAATGPTRSKSKRARESDSSESSSSGSDFESQNKARLEERRKKKLKRPSDKGKAKEKVVLQAVTESNDGLHRANDSVKLTVRPGDVSAGNEHVHAVVEARGLVAPMEVDIDVTSGRMMSAKNRRLLEQHIEEELSKPQHLRKITGPEIKEDGVSEFVKSPQMLARNTLSRQMSLTRADERYKSLYEYSKSAEAAPVTQAYTEYFKSIIELSNLRERRDPSSKSRIQIIPPADGSPPYAPSFFNLVYTNRVYYSFGIVPTQAPGCDCIGNCGDPINRGRCACAARQTEACSVKPWQFNDHSGHKGFAYDSKGCIQKAVLDAKETIMECNSACGCSEDCVNRVVGNKLDLSVDIFWTGPEREWGVRNPPDRPTIKKGQPLGIYAGELIPMDIGAQRAGKLFEMNAADANPIYLFDIDHWTVKEWQDNPAVKQDPDMKEFIRCVRERLKEVDEGPPDDDDDEDDDDDPLDFDEKYGVYTIDATTSGNWTRFCNHSCSRFNAAVRPVIVDDGDLHRMIFCYVALADIPPGREINISYHHEERPRRKPGQSLEDYQRKASIARMQAGQGQKCFCGEDLCRGVLFGK